LNPHVGTMVETGEETDRVLAGSRIGLCLDTGHLLIGGGDPVRVAVEHPDRIAHMHLKDVDLAWARKVQDGSAAYTDAVASGMYVALGEGDVDIAAIVASLEGAGYTGWYVLEQDTILAGDPADPTTTKGAGDPVADVRTSIAHLTTIAESLHSADGSGA
uniref:TIM barrel protein n=1 Tax=Raoultella terrigena TaxID=577 RepID=UPI00132FC74E